MAVSKWTSSRRLLTLTDSQLHLRWTLKASWEIDPPKDKQVSVKLLRRHCKIWYLKSASPNLIMTKRSRVCLLKSTPQTMQTKTMLKSLPILRANFKCLRLRLESSNQRLRLDRPWVTTMIAASIQRKFKTSKTRLMEPSWRQTKLILPFKVVPRHLNLTSTISSLNANQKSTTPTTSAILRRSHNLFLRLRIRKPKSPRSSLNFKLHQPLSKTQTLSHWRRLPARSSPNTRSSLMKSPPFSKRCTRRLSLWSTETSKSSRTNKKLCT